MEIDRRSCLTGLFAFPFLPSIASRGETKAASLIVHARQQIGVTTLYDGAYVALDYPGGDVPEERGVCIDVIIRAYRQAFDFDFQQHVHEDMAANFSAYPDRWGLTRSDRNIDHRRVPNLMTFFKRQGASLGVSQKSEDYLPGDVVSWNLGGGITHIGVVSNIPSRSHPNRYQMIHNIGAGQVLEDCLFSYRITGHFRYRPR